MNPAALILWLAIVGAVLAACGIFNEIFYQLALWRTRRAIRRSALWDIRERRSK